MCTDDVVPTRTTLVDLATLPDEIIVPNISPSTTHSMIGVDRAHHLIIRELPIKALRGMMDDNSVNLLDFLDRPCEEAPVFISLYTRRSDGIATLG